MKSKGYSALDGCQHADRESSEMEIDFPTGDELMWTGPLCTALAPSTT